MGGLKSASLPTAGSSGDSAVSDGSGGFAAPRPTAANTGSAGPARSLSRPAPLDPGNFLGDLASNRIGLAASVGPGAANRPADVTRVQQVLAGAEIPVGAIDGVFGKKTGDAIKTAQERLNRDHSGHIGRTPLKVDGLVTPGGPTQAATRGLAGDVAGQVAEAQRIAAAAEKRAKTPQPAPDPGAVLESPASPLAAPKAAPKPGLRERIAAMAGDDFQSLQRLAQGLRKTTKPGPVSADIAGAFRTDPEAAAAEFSVIRDALEKSGTPEQVANLDAGVRVELTPGERARFDEILAGTDGGADPGEFKTAGQGPTPPTLPTPPDAPTAKPPEEPERPMPPGNRLAV